MPHQLLLADGSVTIQRVIRLTFADEDVNVITVSDGNDAVAAIDESPPDIVLADISLPGRTGYDVARHLRDTPRLGHIPVVLLTGAFDPVDQVLAEAVGCDRVLSKPFDPQVVLLCVRELLARPRKVARPAESFQAIAPLGADVQDAALSDSGFDRLDLAFSSLSGLPAEDIGEKSAFEIEGFEPALVSAGPSGGSDSAVEPFLYAPDVAAFERPFETPRDDSAVAGWEDPSQTAVVRTLLDVVEPLATPPVASDALIDEIATRVIDRLMARLSSEQVSDVVTSVTERLVRAEIDGIKSRL